MIASLASLLGLTHTPTDFLWASGVLVLLGAVLSGWATDAVMGPHGFGVIGNALLVIVALVTGMKTWSLTVGPVTHADLLILLVLSGTLAMMLLLGLATLRQALRG